MVIVGTPLQEYNKGVSHLTALIFSPGAHPFGKPQGGEFKDLKTMQAAAKHSKPDFLL